MSKKIPMVAISKKYYEYLLDRFEQLIRENEQLKIKMEKLEEELEKKNA